MTTFQIGFYRECPARGPIPDSSLLLLHPLFIKFVQLTKDGAYQRWHWIWNWNTWWYTLVLNTVTGLAKFGFTPLLWCPQGPQGCLKKQNYPLISNLVVWCAKIGPKTKKVLKTTKFELSEWFHFSRHRWGSWGCSGVICIWKIFQLSFGCWHNLAKKIVFFKLKTDVSFIILHA